ncbi:tRNA epoxyqueuosine(34) reductase QueG [soil metagenome]
MNTSDIADQQNGAQLASDIRRWAGELGFADCRIVEPRLDAAAERLDRWLELDHHGAMSWMAAHADLRRDPDTLLPGTLRAVCVRMDYLPRDARGEWREEGLASLDDAAAATVSIYARGRDYHKVLRSRLAVLAERVAQAAPDGRSRVFTDSAPVMEVELAQSAGLGWRGKHTLLLDREGGSMVFLGGFYTTLPLPVDRPVSDHCGSCTACIDVCPTGAIVAPYQLDARRCISYLTIEHPGAIPVEFREAIGNRIYGCDDCQLVCPWNKYARRSTLEDFDVRNGFDDARLLALFAWNEAQFLAATVGSAIRRIGHERWQRNLAVALGNALRTGGTAVDRAAIVAALETRLADATPLVAEHVRWALTHAGLSSRSPATPAG